MKNRGQLAALEPIEEQQILRQVRHIPVFAKLEPGTLQCLQQAELIEAEAGDRILEQGAHLHSFWILLEGGLRAEYIDPDGSRRVLANHAGSESFGEVPLLAGLPSKVECVINQQSRLLRISEESFWNLMSSCPNVRKGILANMAIRIEGLQKLVMQQEKLATLGTMSAGLMHELNNPGTAARRAVTQLRENMVSLQQISLSSCRMDLTAAELNCMADLQENILQLSKPVAIGSLEQADAEEDLGRWLEETGIEDAWRLAPPLVSVGLTAEKLECTRANFRPEALSAGLHWIKALVSSVQQLRTIEESVSRISDLVGAVKCYSYAEKMGCQRLDVHESLQSTLIILGHKIRQKGIQVTKEFSQNLPPLRIGTGGLHQVWTNLLDNAVDAAPEMGHITVRTWAEKDAICVGIADDGPGISIECQGQMFEPFHTTKPVGVGTGLGLSIAYKIVTAQCDGEIRVASAPGHTEFTVRLPITTST